jgi:hypothetical protein
MRSRLFALVLATTVVGSATAAQVMPVTMDPFAATGGEDTVRPKTSYPIGQSEMVARSMLAAMRLEQRQRDLCWELGCVVIVNESSSYIVTGFHVQEKKRDGSLGWSGNQFGAPLLSKRATFRFKTGDANTCAQPVKFVLRKPHSKDTLQFETRVPLCSSPHQDSLVRIRAVIPEVEVGS